MDVVNGLEVDKCPVATLLPQHSVIMVVWVFVITHYKSKVNDYCLAVQI